ncbi:type IV pilus assembly protein PilN [Proteiniborus sp. DW1]|uniref:PilN domain-containing protein n=1 Tax=Proteiniborus sp. DW1 TaxID=1889883 RepID=UPI00092DFBA4|nr:PilN domain-containing protein [Proteiniborus sp. DW1]SCG83293.1 type IV pilus assembly protein PilN [Proteiniborus sp. DW1]
MEDLNFFDSYNKKKSIRPNKNLILYGLAILIILGMIIFSVFNLVVINKLNMEVIILKQQVETRKSNKKMNEILAKEKKIKELREKFEQLRQLDDFLDSQDIINEHLLDSITARVPENIFLNSMILNANLITLDGIAKDKKSISDFEHKLGEIKYFEDIFIPAISYEYGYYTFTINIKPKEVEIVGSQDSD